MTLPEEIIDQQYENNKLTKAELGKRAWPILH